MREEVEKDPEKDLPSRMLRGMRARDMATRFDDPSFVSDHGFKVYPFGNYQITTLLNDYHRKTLSYTQGLPPPHDQALVGEVFSAVLQNIRKNQYEYFSLNPSVTARVKIS